VVPKVTILSVPGNGVLTVSSGGMKIGPEPTAGL
jgi:hypothetical protein